MSKVASVLKFDYEKDKFIGALASHLAHGDGTEKYGAAVFALVLVTASYWSYRKLQAVQG